MLRSTSFHPTPHPTTAPYRSTAAHAAYVSEAHTAVLDRPDGLGPHVNQGVWRPSPSAAFPQPVLLKVGLFFAGHEVGNDRRTSGTEENLHLRCAGGRRRYGTWHVGDILQGSRRINKRLFSGPCNQFTSAPPTPPNSCGFEISFRFSKQMEIDGDGDTGSFEVYRNKLASALRRTQQLVPGSTWSSLDRWHRLG